MHYLLEIDIAWHTVEVWSQWRQRVEPTDLQKTEAIIYYAHDFQPTEPLDTRQPDNR